MVDEHLAALELQMDAGGVRLEGADADKRGSAMHAHRKRGWARQNEDGSFVLTTDGWRELAQQRNRLKASAG